MGIHHWCGRDVGGDGVWSGVWTALTSCCSLLSSSATDRSALSFCTVCVAPVGEQSAHAHSNTANVET